MQWKVDHTHENQSGVPLHGPSNARTFIIHSMWSRPQIMNVKRIEHWIVQAWIIEVTVMLTCLLHDGAQALRDVLHSKKDRANIGLKYN